MQALAEPAEEDVAKPMGLVKDDQIPGYGGDVSLAGLGELIGTYDDLVVRQERVWAAWP